MPFNQQNVDHRAVTVLMRLCRLALADPHAALAAAETELAAHVSATGTRLNQWRQRVVKDAVRPGERLYRSHPGDAPDGAGDALARRSVAVSRRGRSIGARLPATHSKSRTGRGDAMAETITTLRLHPETHKRLRDLAREIGTSQVKLVRTLAFATPEEYAECERRRLAAQTTEES